MGKTHDRMAQDLKLRGLSKSTTQEYIRCARRFVAYHRRPAETMGLAEIRQFLMHRNPPCDQRSGAPLKPAGCRGWRAALRMGGDARDRGPCSARTGAIA
jgi:hypothetical protein